MEAKLGDTLRLYDREDYWTDVEIIQRENCDGEMCFDTINSDGSYGNTYPRYKSVEDLIESYSKSWGHIDIIRDTSIQEQWSDLLSGDTLWVTKYELDEILDNLKSLNINTLMIQSCKDKFVIKVDELTVRKHKEMHNED